MLHTIRDWSLISGRGGGAHVKFTPMKMGAEKGLAMLKGGHKKFCSSFYAEA